MPDRNRKARPEFEVAYYTKELGRTVQRRMLQQQLDKLGDASVPEARHGEDAAVQLQQALPEVDRAG
jgi:hypothetical protein